MRCRQAAAWAVSAFSTEDEQEDYALKHAAPSTLKVAYALIECDDVIQTVLDAALNSTAIPNTCLLSLACLLNTLDSRSDTSSEMNRRLNCLAQYLWVAAFETMGFSQAEPALLRFLIRRLQKGKVKLAAIPDEYQDALRE